MPINKQGLNKNMKDNATYENEAIVSPITSEVNEDNTDSNDTNSDNNVVDEKTQGYIETDLQVTQLSEIQNNNDKNDNELKATFENTFDEVRQIPVFTSVRAKQKSGIAGDSGFLSIINPEDNTKCLLIKSELVDRICVKDEVQFGYTATEIIIAKVKSENDNAFRLRKRSNNYVVYSAELVDEIAKHFDLDYSDGRTCRTFGDVRYDDDFNVAYITIK